MEREGTVMKYIGCIVIIAAFFSFASCGLEEDYVVYAPTVVSHEPLYSNVDFAENYVVFRTNDASNDSPSFNYRGTAVYYKIYGSASTLQSNVSAIDSANKSSTGDAANMVINSYQYVELGTEDGGHSPLIKSNGSNRMVYIRLTSYQYMRNDPSAPQRNIEYAPKIIVDYTDDKKAAATYIPVRNVGGKKYHFDFGRSNAAKYTTEYANNAKMPQAQDADVSGASASGKWYVDLYAIGVGNDPTFTKYYSDVLHLGTLPIDANKEDN